MSVYTDIIHHKCPSLIKSRDSWTGPDRTVVWCGAVFTERYVDLRDVVCVSSTQCRQRATCESALGGSPDLQPGSGSSHSPSYVNTWPKRREVFHPWRCDTSPCFCNAAAVIHWQPPPPDNLTTSSLQRHDSHGLWPGSYSSYLRTLLSYGGRALGGLTTARVTRQTHECSRRRPLSGEASDSGHRLTCHNIVTLMSYARLMPLPRQ